MGLSSVREDMGDKLEVEAVVDPSLLAIGTDKSEVDRERRVWTVIILQLVC